MNQIFSVTFIVAPVAVIMRTKHIHLSKSQLRGSIGKVKTYIGIDTVDTGYWREVMWINRSGYCHRLWITVGLWQWMSWCKTYILTKICFVNVFFKFITYHYINNFRYNKKELSKDIKQVIILLQNVEFAWRVPLQECWQRWLDMRLIQTTEKHHKSRIIYIFRGMYDTHLWEEHSGIWDQCGWT